MTIDQKLEAEYTQRAAAKGGKVAGVHQAVRNEIASRGVPAQQHASAPRRAVELAATHSGYRPPIGKPGKWQPLGPMKAATKTSMHKLAGQLKDRHPGIGTHQHVTDAAHALDRGDHDAAIRHLNAGIANLTPQSLLRHGFTNDADHIQAKISMDDIHRHLLLVKDIQESAARNQELVKAQVPATQEDEIRSPAKPPGAQQPPAAAPGSNPPPAPGQPAKQPPPAPGTAGPAPAPQVASAPQPGTGGKPPPKAVAASNGEVTTAVELVGPGGFAHGWQRQTPSAGDHDKAARLHARAAASAKNPLTKAAHLRMAIVHQNIAGDLRAASAAQPPQRADGVTVAAGQPGAGGRVGQELAGLATDQIDLAALRAQNPSAYTFAEPVELSGKTGALATVPHPFGKPGGPGLWHQKGMELPPYVQNIAHAILRTGRAKTLGEAIAIAKGATSRWAKGGGDVKPEVRAASAATNADWEAKRARAHAHANAGDHARAIVELAGRR